MALAPGHARPAGIDELNAFLDSAKNGRSDVRATVVARSGRDAAAVVRNLRVRPPGQVPLEREAVRAARRRRQAKVWVYDKDLNQVIVRPLDAALGATPAALLAGDNALERNFTLVDGGAADGLAWVEATPTSADSTFTKVRIGFRGQLPRAMELVDAFGQTTRLQFDAFERNVALPADLFRFAPPAGADVVAAPAAR
jgi:outer membrane lipoprotein carrier protein